MAGLPGSGKTTLSRALTARGFVRLCPDEEMYRRHGVYGVDFPRGTFPTLDRPVLEDVAVELGQQLEAGHDVVVDHGFWTPEDRCRWQGIATDAGATPVLVYLAATTTNFGRGSANATSSTRTIQTRSTSLRATFSGTALASFPPRQTNPTSTTTATPQP
ncbi:AAA family ATPase [Streptomyces lunaelactis]|uniref:AAA family ATPase n=1 Tax=Streptomyces lunaelactis TaxID=1535768 RepID=UPI0020C80796|nr:ATP-binding protein [Streptomyces lunaelactis]